MTSPPVGMTSTSARAPPQRRRSLGPVSPKRIYRNLSVRLRGRDTPTEGEGPEGTNHHSKVAANYSSLWKAVESGDVLAVQMLLLKERGSEGGERGGQRESDGEEERERAVNSVNEHGLVPLDIAILTHNSPLLQVLVKAGARHNPNLSRTCDWSAKLDELVSLARQRVEERRSGLKAHGPGLSARTDIHRELRLWTLRQDLYTRMRERFHLTKPPGPPGAAFLQMLSDTVLSVSITPPHEHTAGLITTYRVEWSTCASFTPLAGCGFITDTKNLVFRITGLNTGVQYYVRVYAYNIKGWGPPRNSSPPSSAPSSWRQCSNVKIRGNRQEAAMQKLLEQIRAPTYRGYCTENSRQLNSAKRMSMSRGLKQFFHSATKFVRLLQRGAYLAVVFYQKDNILVTAEDQLPLVEIQCCSTSIIQDFLWFAKLSCAWQQVSWLQQAISSSLSSSSSLLQNRHSILRAVNQLQSSLGSVDLGQVYFEPLKDRHGNVLLVTLREVVTSLTPADPHLHWSPLKHLETRWSRTHLLPEPTAMDTLTQQLRRKLEYHRRSLQRAQPGLYIGILKLCSSVEQLRVLVPQRLPNLLLHTRVRNNTHISREEWSWLQSHSMDIMTGSSGGGATGLIDSSGVKEFVRDLRTAVTQLLTKLNIPLYRAYQYRLYTQELVQVGDEISLLLLLPPSEEFSSSFWLQEGVQDPGLTMPLHIFELVHFWAYSRELLSLYCQAWVRLELDAYLAQQALREALDSREVSESRERLAHITQLSQSVEAVWRERRWIMDVMQCVRSRQHLGAVPLHLIMGSQPIKSPHHEEDEKLQELSQTHTYTLTHTGGTVSSLNAYAYAGMTAPVDIPGISDVTESERTHALTETHCLPPPSYSTCAAISQSIPETSHHGNNPCSHSSATFHHSGNGIHHIHSCPELSAFPSSSLSISEEEEDEKQSHGEEMVELFEDLNLQEEKMEPMTDLELVLENKDHIELHANTLENTASESAQAAKQAFSRNADLDSALENAHHAFLCASTVRHTDLESVLEDAHHSTNCTNVIGDTDLEAVHCADAVRDTDLEAVCCADAVRDTYLETVHCADAVRDTDLESVHSPNATCSDTNLERVHYANVARDTDLESVLNFSVCVRAAAEPQLTPRMHELETVCFCPFAVRNTDLESVHCANVVVNTNQEYVHCANAAVNTVLVSDRYANAVRDIGLESADSAHVVKKSDLLEVSMCFRAAERADEVQNVTTRIYEIETIHCANAVRDAALESADSSNAVRDPDLESFDCANVVINTDLESDHCANAVKNADLELVCCAKADRNNDLESAYCPNAVRHTELQSVHCANMIRYTDLKSVHCPNAVINTDLGSVHCANAVRCTHLDLDNCANVVRDTDLELAICSHTDRDADLESVHCATVVKDTALELASCAHTDADTASESVHCANVVKDTALELAVCAHTDADTASESVHCANVVKDTALELAVCAHTDADTASESVHCANVVNDIDLELAVCAHTDADTDLESVHCASVVKDTDLELAVCAHTDRDADLESVHCANVVKDTDLELAVCAHTDRDTDIESVHSANVVKDTDLELAVCAHTDADADLESVHSANVVKDTDLELAVCAHMDRGADLESVHSANVVRDAALETAGCAHSVRDADVESVPCGNAGVDTDLELVHSTNAVKDTDSESVHCANAIRDTGLEAVYCANVVKDDDPELAICTHVDRGTDLQSVYFANTVRDTDLVSVLEVSMCVRTIEKVAAVPQVTTKGCSLPARSMVEWVTLSSNQEVKK